MEIKDNTFARQFEIIVEQGLISVEYSFQERKIFLTKINTSDQFTNENFIDQILVEILEIATDRKLKVVPTYPRIVSFFKKIPHTKNCYLAE